MSNELQISLKKLLQKYFDILENTQSSNLYELVMSQIEPILVKTVLEHNKFNQTHTAKTLGLSRGTLRKLMSKYNLC